jgi:hypothetical protein
MLLEIYFLLLASHSMIDMTPYWIFFAQSFSAEAGERALSSTLFDPASFFLFLNPIEP